MTDINCRKRSVWHVFTVMLQQHDDFGRLLSGYYALIQDDDLVTTMVMAMAIVIVILIVHYYHHHLLLVFNVVLGFRVGHQHRRFV